MSHAPYMPTFFGLSGENLKRFGFKDDPFFRGVAQGQNLFGTPTNEDEIYQGMRRADLDANETPYSDQRAATVRLLEKVVIATSEPAISNPANVCIPAGYTYLLQLVAHDIVQNLAPAPNPGDVASSFARDFRSVRLELDTLYGGGPVQSPLPYAVGKLPRHQRHHFRLSKVPPTDASALTSQTLDNQPARDIGRVACPYLSGNLQASHHGTRTDALIADGRNDDNLILSQLTALFQTFHNLVLDALLNQASASGGNAPGSAEDFRLYRAFLQARLIVGYVFRKIVLEDLVNRLLHPDIYKFYLQKYDSHQPLTLDKNLASGSFVPVEFSHGVFRFGHFMVRPDYNLNGKNPIVGTGQILDRSSSGKEAHKLPVSCDWLVDWSRFFFTVAEYNSDPKRHNASKLIRPDTRTGALINGTRFPNLDEAHPGRTGGLFYRDMIRGVEGQLRTVTSLISHIEKVAHLAPEIKVSQMTAHMDHWLSTLPEGTFNKGEVQSLREEPPLLLYVLVEAEAYGGQRLGPLGSVVVAEVLFASLDQARKRTANDQTLQQLEDPKSGLFRAVFPNGMPGSMSQLIDYIETGIGSKWHVCV